VVRQVHTSLGWLVVSHSTCSPRSSSPHAHSFVLGTGVTNNNKDRAKNIYLFKMRERERERSFTSDIFKPKFSRGGGGGGGGYRAAGRYSAPRGETLLFFPPRHSKTFMASKWARGTAGQRQWVEAHSARTRHNTTCIKQGYKTSARCLPRSLARGCSGSRFFCVPGHAVQGGSSRASSPARPSSDPDHALLFVLSLHF